MDSHPPYRVVNPQRVRNYPWPIDVVGRVPKRGASFYRWVQGTDRFRLALRKR